MRQDLPVTSYALLGLLTLGHEALTGYELKQRAERTLRFYWVAPAMSQVYSELTRLEERDLVASEEPADGGRGTAYRITAAGREALTTWMGGTEAGFPVLKHPVALRLLLGHLSGPRPAIAMLREHLLAVESERAALLEVREMLQGADAPGEDFRYPSLVADWGLEYFDHEHAVVSGLVARLEQEDLGREASTEGSDG